MRNRPDMPFYLAAYLLEFLLTTAHTKLPATVTHSASQLPARSASHLLARSAITMRTTCQPTAPTICPRTASVRCLRAAYMLPTCCLHAAVLCCLCALRTIALRTCPTCAVEASKVVLHISLTTTAKPFAQLLPHLAMALAQCHGTCAMPWHL
ncbi:hypothetical protein Pyn_19229 [Prunus yedoensis var. nudiflora]|uniref:Secreted protein n=1 Tax=Prunus yedoensis var. nudiflora TaxID=2094558 RepID=A0A314U7U4_PRUYE|nr:hypothetical protein Pyn_19229 [Prunus yedoensis var. nudiflora]